jgi:hypothetical protein
LTTRIKATWPKLATKTRGDQYEGEAFQRHPWERLGVGDQATAAAGDDARLGE